MSRANKWRRRVSAQVIECNRDRLVVVITDAGTRRSPAGEVGRMTLTKTHGYWCLDTPSRLDTWADAGLAAWCRRVGGGVDRTAALVKAAQDAAYEQAVAEFVRSVTDDLSQLV